MHAPKDVRKLPAGEYRVVVIDPRVATFRVERTPQGGPLPTEPFVADESKVFQLGRTQVSALNEGATYGLVVSRDAGGEVRITYEEP